MSHGMWWLVCLWAGYNAFGTEKARMRVMEGPRNLDLFYTSDLLLSFTSFRYELQEILCLLRFILKGFKFR